MHTLATWMRVQRLLILASVTAILCLALAAGPAYAHAGHTHRPAKMAVAETMSVAETPSQAHAKSGGQQRANTQLALSFAVRGALADPADTTVGCEADAQHDSHRAVSASRTQQTPDVQGICAAGCGACSSVSCCAMGILPDAAEMIAPTLLSELTPTRTSVLTSGQIAPLPRPPNARLLA